MRVGEGVLFRVGRPRKKKKKRSKSFGFWKPSVDSKETGCIPEYSGKRTNSHARGKYSTIKERAN